MNHHKRRSNKSRGGSRSRYPNKLPLPPTTVGGFQYLGNSCENIGLLFDRYLRFTSSRESAWDMGKYDRNNTAKQWNLERIVEAQSTLQTNWVDKGFKAVIDRWVETARSQQATPFRLTPEWRLAIGLGNETALENGFTFHRIYGFPIIPGSALKGLARAAALSEIADIFNVSRLSLSQIKELGNNKTPLQKLDDWLLQSDEEMAKQSNFDLGAAKKDLVKCFRRIFGTQQAAGEAVFFDAMPAEAPTLEIDVMNVHYPDYYSGDVFPTDSQNPNPIPFLTVGKTPFWFAVGWRNEVDQEGLKQARDWLETGLREFGIGAKTAAGYGYFEVE